VGEFNCPDLDPEGDTDDFIPVYRGTPHPVTPRVIVFEPAVKATPTSPPPAPEPELPDWPIPWPFIVALAALAGLLALISGHEVGR
jgi:hypothetical protein